MNWNIISIDFLWKYFLRQFHWPICLGGNSYNAVQIQIPAGAVHVEITTLPLSQHSWSRTFGAQKLWIWHIDAIDAIGPLILVTFIGLLLFIIYYWLTVLEIEAESLLYVLSKGSNTELHPEPLS